MAKKKARESGAIAKAAEALAADTPRLSPIPRGDFLSTGCALFNMGLSGDPDLGIPKGAYAYLVGESSSGKTWMGHVFFAEAARNPSFVDYRFVFDNAENGALMDVERFFGRSVVDRLEAPAYDKGAAVYSSTAQEMYFNLAANVRRGPCIYLLDSMDALNDEADDRQFEAAMAKHFTGKGEVPGNMGMAKAKTNSKNINRVTQLLRTNGSILVVISQTRSKVNSQYAGQRTRSGGDALRFYASVEVWFKLSGVLAKEHNGIDREYGTKILGDVAKNRITGWEGKLPPIHFLKGFGIDDTGSCVEYLIDEKHWPKDGQSVSADEFDYKGRPERLIKVIEDDPEGPDKLHRVVAGVWRDIIAKVTPVRKSRYA